MDSRPRMKYAVALGLNLVQVFAKHESQRCYPVFHETQGHTVGLASDYIKRFCNWTRLALSR